MAVYWWFTMVQCKKSLNKSKKMCPILSHEKTTKTHPGPIPIPNLQLCGPFVITGIHRNQTMETTCSLEITENFQHPKNGGKDVVEHVEPEIFQKYVSSRIFPLKGGGFFCNKFCSGVFFGEGWMAPQGKTWKFMKPSATWNSHPTGMGTFRIKNFFSKWWIGIFGGFVTHWCFEERHDRSSTAHLRNWDEAQVHHLSRFSLRNKTYRNKL